MIIPLFAPDSALPLVLLNYLLESLLAIFPGYAAASPGRQAELRQVAMLMLDAHGPQTAAQAMLAASAITAQVQANECLRLATAPDTQERVARRYTSLGTSLLRCGEQALRRLQRDQAARRKADAIPEHHPTPAPAADSRHHATPSSAASAQAQPRPAAAPRPAATLPGSAATPHAAARMPHAAQRTAIDPMTQAAAKAAVAQAMQRAAHA